MVQNDHYNLTIDGKETKLPRVTAIINRFYGGWQQHIKPDVLERACQFGTHVHKACELFDNDSLDLMNLDYDLRLPLGEWIKFKSDHKVEILFSELKVHSKRFRYAGTLDRVAFVDGVVSLIDIKTRPYNSPYDDLQTAAYMAAFNETRTGGKIKKRYIISLGMGIYKLHECKGKQDIDIFRCMTNIFNWEA